MSEKIDHPAHYNNSPSGVECIDVAEHMNFNRGNAVKYVWRAGAKGDEIEDLQKAIWYLQREVARLQKAKLGTALEALVSSHAKAHARPPRVRR